MNIDNLTTAELMALQVEVNNRVEQIKEDAFTCLSNDESYPGFELKAGRVSRFIKDPESYERILDVCLGDKAYKVSYIPLTAAEKLIKDEDILNQLKTTYGTKTSNPSLIYTGEFNE